jgi:hypothetical protein
VVDALILERDSKAIPELIEPANGLPFRFDSSTRMLHAPEDAPLLKLPW